MRRNRDNASTIRGQLTRIVLIPSLCFLTLWLVVAAVGMVQAVQLMGAVTQAREGTAVYSRAADELRVERRLSLVYQGRFESGGPDAEAGAALDEQRAATDTALGAAVELAERLSGTRDDEVQRSAAALTNGPEVLAALRTRIDEHAAGREEALLGYGEMLDATTDATTALVHTTDGGENLTDAVLTSELLGAGAENATADALLAGSIARGEMSYAETAHFTYLTASYRDTLESAAAVMHPSVRERYEEMTATQEWDRTEALSRQVVTRPPITESGPDADGEVEGVPVAELNTAVDVDAGEWDEASPDAVAHLDALALAQAERTVDLAWSAALLRVSLGAAAAVTLLVGGVAAIAVVGRSSRRLTERLLRLRRQILERDEDLPDIVDRAQRGRKVDVQEELPPLDECGDDEIGQVAEAFDSAQLTAVEAAVRQAEIRRGANRAFLGIAFRNQNLVQRQLRLLDEIEYHEQNPDALRRLFRLDHMATQARRYADNLIILGGGQSARRWRQPHPLVDVLRAAIAETEDFERVRLTSAPRVLMHGQVVADVVHLLAELVENATQFSPAGTPVDVSCTPSAEGLVVEVEDRGLGMSDHGYAAAERTLNQPPEFDVMALPDDPRLGLFVVARLAERHGVRVWLRPSPYGGTRATTLIPKSLLEPVENPVTVSGSSQAAQGAPGLTGPQSAVRPAGPTGPQGVVPPYEHTGPLSAVPSFGNGAWGAEPSYGPRGPQTAPIARISDGSRDPALPGGWGDSRAAAPVPAHGSPGPSAGPTGPQGGLHADGRGFTADRDGPRKPVLPTRPTPAQGAPPSHDPDAPTGPQSAVTHEHGETAQGGEPGGPRHPALPQRAGLRRGSGPTGQGAPRTPAPTPPGGHGER
ncbi:nitrate- and nitrite sensing domain-containing protein [Nocardiopsis sp. CT-R113]|uniref:histidine kinase n=1 Tax=Nocardiopsis codii TaxID=3065942 RepID=A0ABU7KES3_9ACTN|nr:nitrate- and nitrite sensing domain-containing protein [Nocardiopsis sp. CT-R113]MEE2040409.1 nitrate- and nitrite sensing domain-containing protein [Nocardiopsis sp. CT-R113]